MSKVLWSFVAVALIWVLTNVGLNEGVKNELQANAEQALQGIVEQPVVTVAGRDVRVIGDVTTPASMDTVAKAVKGAWGVRKFDANASQLSLVEVPAYTFGADLDAGQLTLTGQVADANTRSKLMNLVAKLFPSVAVDNQLTLGDGAPAGAFAAISGGLQGLSRLTEGRLDVEGTDVRLSGVARYARAVDSIKARLSQALPDGFEATFGDFDVMEARAALDADACEAQVKTLLENTRILFMVGSATISKNSAGLLDRIVATFSRCPSAQVVITGYTDNTGDADANLKLSQQRALSVLGYLVNAGLSGDSFTAQGYGQQDPVADNATDEGRTRNRRIEFTIQQ